MFGRGKSQLHINDKLPQRPANLDVEDPNVDWHLVLSNEKAHTPLISSANIKPTQPSSILPTNTWRSWLNKPLSSLFPPNTHQRLSESSKMAGKLATAARCQTSSRQHSSTRRLLGSSRKGPPMRGGAVCSAREGRPSKRATSYARKRCRSHLIQHQHNDIVTIFVTKPLKLRKLFGFQV